MYTAAFFDVDGTLQSFKTKSVPASAVEALHLLREKGLKIIIATGRHKSELASIRSLFEFDAYITLNGQYCFDSEGVFRKRCLDPHDVQVAVDLALKNDIPCYFVEEEAKYISRVDDQVREVCRLVGSPDPDERHPGNVAEAEILQLCVYLPRKDAGLYLEKTRNVDAARWHPYFMDITPKGGSKRMGIEAVMSRYGLDPKHTIAFGDGENDIAMLQYAGTGVAVGNAQEEVKQAADYVTADVDDDGILKAVRELVL